MHSLSLDKKKSISSLTSISTPPFKRSALNEEIDYWLEKKVNDFTKGYFRALNPGIKRLRALCGCYPVDKLTPPFLFNLRLFLAEDGLSKATQNRYIAIIQRVLNFSCRQGRLEANPTVDYEKVREDARDMLFWSEDEVQRFLAFTNEKYPFGTNRRWIYCVYRMALETGMRAGEIWGFRVSDVPKSGNKAKVSQQAIGAREFDVTKGKKSRFVPLSDSLIAEISSLLKSLENPFSRKTLFATNKGTAINQDNFVARIFRVDIQESGLPLIRFHDLRHTALTLFVKREVALPVIQAIAGHRDIRTTMRYIHVVGADIDLVGARASLFSLPCKKSKLCL